MRKTAVALLLVLIGCQPGYVNFTLTFKDVESLKPGDPVVYKGTDIGRVTTIDPAGNVVRVAVSIDAVFRANVYREAIYVIDSPSGFFASGSRITIKDRPFARVKTLVQEDDVVVGWNGIVGKALGKVLP